MDLDQKIKDLAFSAAQACGLSPERVEAEIRWFLNHPPSKRLCAEELKVLDQEDR